MDEACYTFDAIRGTQAGKAYFLVMCPLKLINKIFLYDEEELPAELRAQRTLNKSRIPEISKYMVENYDQYVFSAITASIDGKISFHSFSENGTYRNIGKLEVAMISRLIINDGQHRRAAIDAAICERRDLGEETIAVVFFIDEGLKRSQQLFVDLNKHAVRPSTSLNILYDHREALAELSKRVTEKVAGFRGMVDMEHTSISNRSIKLFTLSGVYQATKALLQKSKGVPFTEDDELLAIEYWNTLSDVFPEWTMASKKKVSTYDLRREFVHSHAVVLHALGLVGASLIATYPDDWQKRLQHLSQLDWSRTNTRTWEGRAMIGGRMSKAHNNVMLTAAYLKKILDLPLTPEEVRVDEFYMRSLVYM